MGINKQIGIIFRENELYTLKGYLHIIPTTLLFLICLKPVSQCPIGDNELWVFNTMRSGRSAFHNPLL